MYFGVPFTKTLKPKPKAHHRASTLKHQNIQEDNVNHCGSKNSFSFTEQFRDYYERVFKKSSSVLLMRMPGLELSEMVALLSLLFY